MQDQINEVWRIIEAKLAEHNITLGSVTGKLSGIFSNVKSAASTLFFSVIFSIYFLLDGNNIGRYWGRVCSAFLPEKTRSGLKVFLADADRCFSGYIRGQFIDAVLVGLISIIALEICKVPYAPAVGFLTGLGNLIPYVGPIVGIVSLVGVCLAQGAMNRLLVGGIVLVIIMAVDGNVINPRLLSSNIEVHPLLVFAAMIAGSAIGGLVGMVVAVPMAALLKLQFDKWVARKEQEKNRA